MEAAIDNSLPVCPERLPIVGAVLASRPVNCRDSMMPHGAAGHPGVGALS